ncbi:MAG: hypothetical protein ACM3TR_00660 [Caulobacteraceae bacterium]
MAGPDEGIGAGLVIGIGLTTGSGIEVGCGVMNSTVLLFELSGPSMQYDRLEQENRKIKTKTSLFELQCTLLPPIAKLIVTTPAINIYAVAGGK